MDEDRIQRLSYRITRGNIAEIQIPRSVSLTDIDILQEYLDLLKKSIRLDSDSLEEPEVSFEYCPNCRESRNMRVELREETTTLCGLTVKTAARVKVCEGCGQSIYDEALDDVNSHAAFDAYRQAKGIPYGCPPPVKIVKGENGSFRMECAVHGRECEYLREFKGKERSENEGHFLHAGR